MTLLEIGCGWGLTLQRAMEKYDVNVIGLTLSKNQQAYCNQLLDKVDSKRTFDVRLEGWEQFHRPVDRIVSIEAFEHFGFERYDDFFKTCFDIMPDDGRMTIQSSVGYHPDELVARGKKLTFELARFVKFMITEIFPGGRLPTTSMMVEHRREGGLRPCPRRCRCATTTSRRWASGLRHWRTTRTRRSRPPTRRTTTGT